MKNIIYLLTFAAVAALAGITFVLNFNVSNVPINFVSSNILPEYYLMHLIIDHTIYVHPKLDQKMLYV